MAWIASGFRKLVGLVILAVILFLGYQWGFGYWEWPGISWLAIGIVAVGSLVIGGNVKRAGLTLAVILAMVNISVWADEYNNPPSVANIREADIAATKLAKKGAELARPVFDKAVKGYDGTNLDAVAHTGNQRADLIAREQATGNAWRARANNVPVLDAKFYTDVQNPWRTCVDFYEDLEVFDVSGTVTNFHRPMRAFTTPLRTVSAVPDYEQVPPAGTKLIDWAVGRYDLPLPDNSRHLALIGKVCSATNATDCSAPLLIGEGNRILVSQVGGRVGQLCTAANENMTLSHAAGGFSWRYRTVN